MQFSNPSHRTRSRNALKKCLACSVSSLQRRKVSSLWASTAKPASTASLPGSVASNTPSCEPRTRYRHTNTSKRRPGVQALWALSTLAASRPAAPAVRRPLAAAGASSGCCFRRRMAGNPSGAGNMRLGGAPRCGLLTPRGGMRGDDGGPSSEGAPLLHGPGLAHRSVSAPAVNASAGPAHGGRYGSVPRTTGASSSVTHSLSNTFAWRRVRLQPWRLCCGARRGEKARSGRLSRGRVAAAPHAPRCCRSRRPQPRLEAPKRRWLGRAAPVGREQAGAHCWLNVAGDALGSDTHHLTHTPPGLHTGPGRRYGRPVVGVQ